MAKTRMIDKAVAYSAVIPTVGREETLPAVLLGLLHQTRLPQELIILDESRKPVSEHYFVNQAIDTLSLKGVKTKIVRNRNRAGIGAARLFLADEARNELVLMVDDDVVLEPTCAEELIHSIQEHHVNWAVPTCFLVPANFALDGYCDKPVDIDDPNVQRWTQKYPWFIPYFQYTEPVECLIPSSGTQAILVKRTPFKNLCSRLPELGVLPREDTYLTSVMGQGVFTSRALCRHFEHPSQAERGNWSSSMFYRLHEACMESPEVFVNLLGGK